MLDFALGFTEFEGREAVMAILGCPDCNQETIAVGSHRSLDQDLFSASAKGLLNAVLALEWFLFSLRLVFRDGSLLSGCSFPGAEEDFMESVMRFLGKSTSRTVTVTR